MQPEIYVHCRADYAYPGCPRHVTWEDHTYIVEQLLSTWREPDAYGFRVAVEGQIFDLAYLPHADRWVLRRVQRSAG
jgi:hypothetical protein